MFACLQQNRTVNTIINFQSGNSYLKQRHEMPEIVDIIDDEMEIVEEENRSVMSVNLGELTLDSTLDSTLNSTRDETVESDHDIEIGQEAAINTRSGKRTISFAKIDSKCQNWRQSNPPRRSCSTK